MAEQPTFVLYDESQLPRECLIHSEQKLGETKTKREEKLRELMIWVDRKSQIKLACNNKVWLLYFLRATKFRIDKAKSKIKRFVIIFSTDRSKIVALASTQT